MKTEILKVEGIHCKSCELIIEDSLNDIGVKELSFNGNQLKVSFDETKISIGKIKQTIKKEGYKVD